nr:F-box protein At5g07610-like [Coffea arabica]
MLSAESTKIFFDLLKTSAQSMSIPDIDQVLEEVLLKLPVDVLLTFKCVSKQWLSIISHPAFGYLHFRGNPGMYFVAGFLFYHLSEPRNPRSAFIYLEEYGLAMACCVYAFLLVGSTVVVNTFDPYVSQYYKAVCVSIVGMQYRFSIYSSETKIWREAGNALDITNEDHYLKRGVFCNNSVHWISKLGPFLHFDTDKECVQMMPATPIHMGK